MAFITSPNGYVFYHYIPSKVGAIIVAALFAAGTLAVLWRSISTRTKFAIPLMVGGVCKSFIHWTLDSLYCYGEFSLLHCKTPTDLRVLTSAVEIIGYVGRAIAKDKEDSPLVPFIMQSVLLLVAPALFAASIYMTLGRVIRSVQGERHSIIRPTRLTRFFVLLDVVSFFTQATGGGFQASKNFNKKTAEYIILGGLVVQILGFGLFTVTALTWHVRMTRWPTAATLADKTGKWQKIMIMLCAVSLLIMIRSVFRVIEYVMGADGYLLMHEWPLYVFDAVLMMLTVAVFAWWYPGRLDVVSINNQNGYNKEAEVV